MIEDQDIDWLATMHFISLVDSFVRESGYSTEQLMQGVDLKVEELLQGSALTSPAQECAILHNALYLTKDRYLGLVLGSRCRVASFGIFGFTLLSSRNLREALSLLFEYPLPLLGSGYQLELIEKHGEALLCVRDSFDAGDGLRLLAIEFCLTALHRLMGDLLCRELPLSSVNIARGASNRARYRQHFECPVSTSPSLSDSLSFDARWLDLPLPWAHPIAHGEMKRQCADLKLSLEVQSSILGNVRSAILSQFDQAPTLTGIAQSMGCSSKTLQRQLRAAGTNFGEVLGELRYQRAQELLLQQVPVTRIAERLGFSEPAAFRRAFQRWSGCTPSQYRCRVHH